MFAELLFLPLGVCMGRACFEVERCEEKGPCGFWGGCET